MNALNSETSDQQTNTTEIQGGTSLGTINTEDFGKLKQDFSNLKSDFDKQNNEMVSLRRELEKSKFDLITLLGIFVGLITYLGLEIQVFKTINDPLLIIGVSIFFISSILLFILSISNIINKTGCLEWKDFKNPLNVILVSLLAISVFFIIIGYSNFLNTNTVPIGVVLQKLRPVANL